MMMLESMIAAYTMSTMSVDGTRPSEPTLGLEKLTWCCFSGEKAFSSTFERRFNGSKGLQKAWEALVRDYCFKSNAAAATLWCFFSEDSSAAFGSKLIFWCSKRTSKSAKVNVSSKKLT